MGVLGAALVVGLVLTVRWIGVRYEAPHPVDAGTVRAVVVTYFRGVAIALVGGFWAGLLVTGPAIRLIMRLLAVTAGDDAQGRLTEAEEVIGDIDLGGTLGLIVFGGLFSGVVSGAIYIVVRRWLPSGRWAGVAFGGLHLVIAATRVDPLRPDNRDFDLVGPGWLAVVTFGVAAVLHGVAVVAFANRYSRAFLSEPDQGVARRRVILPLAVPGLLALVAIVVPVAIVAGLVLVVVLSRSHVIVDAVRSRTVVVCGRVLLAGLALVTIPGAVTNLSDIVNREEPSALAG